mmetsp:Transcript_38/g.65  ORF Transcript_38/g.65 Transcript_38/m.65 type:complete len:113 (-) Transcript_38:243-581(-)|eukprot:CAMPEP_0184643540 /NCGR_PEP_ID=MMETSP0308-20130426/390_1 /TAXON_ID=38269 /ORGANISM="Gloeochaete witrockiana, Strain SAG 46.84" /LENGTH=112 /DNA_ID=CAMNT_0027071541 /DNA_START=137 /DNA_END=475 /DNA_ORIENTATION=+
MSSAGIENLRTVDPFAESEGQEGNIQAGNIHIRIQQRNGRKSLTTVTGLSQELDLKKILKAVKKSFCCNGTIVDDPEVGQVVQLQGDQRKQIAQFLIEEGITKKEAVKIHGF